jgi:hypothetical protein
VGPVKPGDNLATHNALVVRSGKIRVGEELMSRTGFREDQGHRGSRSGGALVRVFHDPSGA